MTRHPALYTPPSKGIGERALSISLGLLPVETNILCPLFFASIIASRALSGRPFPKGRRVPSTSKKKLSFMSKFYISHPRDSIEVIDSIESK